MADLASSLPVSVDSLNFEDRSGGYATHKRFRRQTCHYAAIEVSDVSSWKPTFTPFELDFEIGAKSGLGRTPAASFTGQGR